MTEHRPGVHFIAHDEAPPACVVEGECVYMRGPRPEDDFFAIDRSNSEPS